MRVNHKICIYQGRLVPSLRLTLDLRLIRYDFIYEYLHFIESARVVVYLCLNAISN